MIYIFLSVCCSVFVSVLLKLAKRYEIDVRQAITWNYSIAGLLSWLIFKPEIPEFSQNSYPVYIALGLLLPLIFVVLAKSVKHTGIVKSDIAQRLSLFIPVLAAFLIYNEPFTVTKIIGILIAFTAIIFSVPWHKQNGNSNSYWIYPIVVFIGMGIIDILFKQIARAVNIPFTSSLLVVFILAFIISITYLLYQILVNGLKLTIINLVCGWILGIANFGNIVFYLKAHQTLNNQPSVVFSSMNIGVILLGSAVGILIFKEKLSRLNYAGIVLSLISILILTLAE